MKNAADQILSFFASKHQLFGEEKLTKEITIEDLNEEDIACQQRGALQLAGRDQSGRQLFVFYARLFGRGRIFHELTKLFEGPILDRNDRLAIRRDPTMSISNSSLPGARCSLPKIAGSGAPSISVLFSAWQHLLA